jgi:hypothetical protein
VVKAFSCASPQVHAIEFLALKWAVTDKFSDYLMTSKFIAYTDNNPLTYVLSSTKLDAPDITCEIQKRRTPSLFWASAKSTLLEMKGSER